VDTTTLVSDLIEDGRRIVEELPQAGFEVTAAFWLKASEDGLWYFYIVSPLAETEPLNDAESIRAALGGQIDLVIDAGPCPAFARQFHG